MAEPPLPPPPEQLKLRQGSQHYGYLNREKSNLPGMDDAANFRAMQVRLGKHGGWETMTPPTPKCPGAAPIIP